MENERSVHFEQLLKGRFPLTHYFYVLRDGPLEKLWGGGRGIFEPQEFFSVIKFLV